MFKYSLGLVGVMFCSLGQVSAVEAPASLQSALDSATPGQVLSLGFSSTANIPALNAFPNRLETTGGSLIYSDDPETVLEFGNLYRAELSPGLHRLYLYHVNGRDDAMRFAAVAVNRGTEPVSFEIRRQALHGPSANYLDVGRKASASFFSPSVTTLSGAFGPADAGFLDTQLFQTVATKNQLVNAIYEIETDGEIEITVIAVPRDMAPFPLPTNLPFSPDDGDNREGTFSGIRREGSYAWNTDSGMARLRIGDGGEFLTDPPLSGIDEQDQTTRLLRGNYGVEYEIAIDIDATDGRRFAVLLNPRGGNYGGYFEISFGGAEAIGQIVPATGLIVPPTTESGVIALIDPLENATETGELTLRMTPAGASSLAIDVLLVPYGDTREPKPPLEAWMVY